MASKPNNKQAVQKPGQGEGESDDGGRFSDKKPRYGGKKPYDSKKNKTHSFDIKPGFTDAATAVLQVRRGLAQGLSQLNLKLQHGSNGVKVKNLTIDLSSLKVKYLKVQALSSSSIKTREYDYTNDKGQLFKYFLAENFGYLPVMIQTNYKSKVMDVDLEIKLATISFFRQGDCHKIVSFPWSYSPYV